MSSIKVRWLHIFIMMFVYGTFLFIKERFGERTPDEVFYTSELVNPDDISLKFFITQAILKTLYGINIYLYPIINILIALYIFNYLYKREVVEGKTLKVNTLLLLFFLPSTIYFCSAYLRDIYIFYFVTLFVFATTIQNQKRKWGLLFIAFSILRYEAGLIVFLAFFFNYFISKNNKTYFKVSVLTLPIIVFGMWVLLFYLFENDWVWLQVEELIFKYEKNSLGYGVLQLPITKMSVLLGSIINWFAFYAPFLFKPITSAFSILMFLDSILVGGLFFRVFINFKASVFFTVPLYRISLLVFFASFFVAIPESVPETIYRHRMAYLPFLIFLNFKTKNEKLAH